MLSREPKGVPRMENRTQTRMQTRVVQPDSLQDGVARRPTPSIEVRALTKRYGSITALSELDLSVPANSIFGFLGPNGAGKTTTIKLLLGLAAPSAGQARVFGLDAVTDSLAIRQRVGYLAQDPRYYAHMTARETLEFTARFFTRGPGSRMRARIAETLDLVGLGAKADRPIKGFSGGERQRLGLAQAQVNHPDLLILDEPAAALDPVGRRDVLDVMVRLRERTTIFYSTHILDDVQRVSDQVAILDEGRLVTQAPTVELLRGQGTAFEIVVDGDGSAAERAVRARPWVASVMTTGSAGGTALEVTVTDEAAARAELLPLVVGTGAVVSRFGRRTLDLEDVFLRLVEGGPR
jgi:ABC-2 type transport system ATP-binding protein